MTLTFETHQVLQFNHSSLQRFPFTHQQDVILAFNFNTLFNIWVEDILILFLNSPNTSDDLQFYYQLAKTNKLI